MKVSLMRKYFLPYFDQSFHAKFAPDKKTCCPLYAKCFPLIDSFADNTIGIKIKRLKIKSFIFKLVILFSVKIVLLFFYFM